ncbi:alpha-L-fucosidase [Tamlana fucoidanivorans]|uniref:alpha-L-fucosidase n=1 Tax=Allotamlana fucoidanivorans TaxID=2583814 RepID=A0A5C4SPJ8_9FLAO|nr:alpha-L-fucosidase [Tamlana fucoidanivorans]TNJ46060.1 alpha-L-fucosidase [Tamlana fucoidanivorans]
MNFFLKYSYVCYIMCFSILACAQNSKTESKLKTQTDVPYTANWESLSKHNASPDWFRDAKFGIYFHWGVYSVPAFHNEWYPRNMHIIDSKANKHHIEKYGHPYDFGYHDFIPMFKAENFDADKWAKLFKKSGARFAGPVAEHHDGFSMWNSKVNPWNAFQMGPKRDIVGEMEKAVKGNGLKFITSFHHARQWNRTSGSESEKFYNYLKDNYPKLLEDDKNKLLYGEMPWEEFQNIWFDKLAEVIDKYNPDMMWFDTALDNLGEPMLQKYCAYYLNHATKTKQEVVIFYKHQDLPNTVGVLDYEKGRADELAELPWLTDASVTKSSWGFTDRVIGKNKIYSGKAMIHTLIDIVSKNGQLLLNIAPMANGTIPKYQEETLLEMGEWLDLYGEAIYSTRPFREFGKGPTKFGKTNPEGTPEDVRYTQSKDGKYVYAIFLGYPDSNSEVNLKALNRYIITIESAEILGSDEKVNWNQTATSLSLKFPAKAPLLAEKATVVKLKIN